MEVQKTNVPRRKKQRLSSDERALNKQRGINKLAVLWNNNTKIMYYNSTKYQDKIGAFQCITKNILEKNNRIAGASWCGWYRAGVLIAEWTSDTQQWRRK